MQVLRFCSVSAFRSPVPVFPVLDSDLRQLNVSIDVEAVVFTGQDDGAVVHEGDVEALGVLDLALQGREELAVLREDGQVEVVVVVGDRDLAGCVDADADRVIGDAWKNKHKVKVRLVKKVKFSCYTADT